MVPSGTVAGMARCAMVRVRGTTCLLYPWVQSVLHGPQRSICREMWTGATLPHSSHRDDTERCAVSSACLPQTHVRGLTMRPELSPAPAFRFVTPPCTGSAPHQPALWV